MSLSIYVGILASW